jgi:hypothetical protein
MRFDKILNHMECNEFVEYFNSHSYYDDNQVKNSKILHNWPKVMDLCVKLTQQIQDKTGLLLIPHQAWIRKYTKGNILKRHIDGRADYALSILLDTSNSTTNPLLIYYDDIPTEVNLEKGDGYFFEGSIIQHERNEIKSDYIYGLYLGYLKRPPTTLI